MISVDSKSSEIEDLSKVEIPDRSTYFSVVVNIYFIFYKVFTRWKSKKSCDPHEWSTKAANEKWRIHNRCAAAALAALSSGWIEARRLADPTVCLPPCALMSWGPDDLPTAWLAAIVGLGRSHRGWAWHVVMSCDSHANVFVPLVEITLFTQLKGMSVPLSIWPRQSLFATLWLNERRQQ